MWIFHKWVKHVEPHGAGHHHFYDNPDEYIFECQFVPCCPCSLLDCVDTMLHFRYMYVLSNRVVLNFGGV